MERTIRNFSAQQIDGEVVSLSQYYGSILLIVNLSDRCKQVTQLEEIQRLYITYKDRGFVVLGFPCNQLSRHQYDDDYTIKLACIQKHGITFPLFSKIEVNGKEAHALFKWLKNSKRGFFSKRIYWNFTKFIIGKDGKPIRRFGPFVSISHVEKVICQLLAESQV